MQERKLEAIELYKEYENCNRWAVIVGISQYQHQPWNLNYADRDAEELYKLLLTENGGNFLEKNICKLINKKATTENIRQALNTFLKKPDREDLVIIYFACHGTPDPERPENLYLLTHNTKPDDISGTALEMEAIDSALKKTLLAEKVIVFADTCHSGGIGGTIGNRNIGDRSELMNRYLQILSQSVGGIALLTSAEAREVSREGKQWGGGHGVFTHYLLEGMRGEADRDQNGIVTIGELFEYVRDRVKDATDYKQHPSIGTNAFDRNLPITVTTKKQEVTEKQIEKIDNHPQKKHINLPKILLSFFGTTLIIILGIWKGIDKNKRNTIPTSYPTSFPEITHTSSNKNLLLQEITSCGASKDAVRELDNQIFLKMLEIAPDALVSLDDLNIEGSNYTYLYLQPQAKEALKKAVQEHGQKLQVNSAYRSITSQQILFNHAKNNRCGIIVAAPPGHSNHQSGLAIDINDANDWKPYLEKYGWRFSPNDSVHFDYIGSGTQDISKVPILAFQKLWNITHPNDKIIENGLYDSVTENRMNKSPVDGFQIFR